MARPKKDARVKRNGDYLQVFDEGVFVASFSCAEMVRLAKLKKRIGTNSLLAQEGLIKEMRSLEGKSTNDE